MLRIIISGANGRMGQVLAETAAANPDTEVVAGIDLRPDARDNPYPVFASAAECTVDADCIIDFSRPGSLAGNIEYCKAHGAFMVVATTGMQQEHKDMLKAASSDIPVFFAANMSLGVNLQLDLCRQAADSFGRDVDIEIIEKHHRGKVDAPSGTALALADEINASYAGKMRYEYDRHSKTAPREKMEIGIHAVRGGSIVGEHEVLFIGDDETLTIRHQTHKRQVFAAGALRAALFMQGKKAGFYSMKDLIYATRTVTNVTMSHGEAVMTMRGVPHDIAATAHIFSAVADKGINIDIITQTSPMEGRVDIAFSLPESDLGAAMEVMEEARIAAVPTRHLTKLTVEGIGMEHNYGVAARLFTVLAEHGVEIEIVTTSETKISFCVDSGESAKAEAAIKEAFNL